mgnify:FL=1
MGLLFEIHEVPEFSVNQEDGHLYNKTDHKDEWYSLVEYAAAYSKEDIHFTFKNGMEIKA